VAVVLEMAGELVQVAIVGQGQKVDWMDVLVENEVVALVCMNVKVGVLV